MSKQARSNSCSTAPQEERAPRWNALVQQGQIVCSQCNEERQLSSYDARHLERLLQHQEIHKAVCLRCDSAALRGESSKQYKCCKCKKSLPLSAFSVETRKRHGENTWRCEACQRPTCIHCGRRPDSALTYDSGAREEYLCKACLYPPCSGGCGKPRPPKYQGRREQNVR